MSGVTRLGFAGTPSPEERPLSKDDPRSARTVFGRDIHLPAELRGRPTPLGRPLAITPVPAGAVTPGPVATPVARSGKSHLPAVARLVGRWNTLGLFEASGGSDDELAVPRTAWMRPALLIAVTALITFALVLGFVRLRQPAPAQPRIAEPAPTTAVAAPAVAPAPAVPPRPTPPALDDNAVLPVKTTAAPAPRPARSSLPRRSAAPKPTKKASGPDDVLPPAF